MFDLTGLIVENYIKGTLYITFNDDLVAYSKNNPAKNIDNEIMDNLYTQFLYMHV